MNTTQARIRIAALQKGVKINELCELAGLKIHRLAPTKEPSRSTLKAVAAVLGVDWRQLLGD